MEKLVFDSGIRSYKVNDTGVLKFNPSDPNLFARFLDAKDKLIAVEEELVKKGEELQNQTEPGEVIIRIMEEADKQAKSILNQVFGHGNDFNEIMAGVNLLAVAGNGERVITNFLNAIVPILEEGARKAAKQQAGAVAAEIKGNRAARRAKK